MLYLIGKYSWLEAWNPTKAFAWSNRCDLNAATNRRASLGSNFPSSGVRAHSDVVLGAFYSLSQSDLL